MPGDPVLVKGALQFALVKAVEEPGHFHPEVHLASLRY
jgi:hypothetical protein